MTKLNEHILSVMKWLDDPAQFTQKQIKENRVLAAAAADDADDAAAKIWVKRYFEHSGENKQDYLDKIKADKMERPVKKDEQENIYTEAMCSAGKECEVGMSFRDDYGVIYEKLMPSDSSGMTVIKDKNGELCLFCESGINPFEKRTDKQKLADQIDKYVIDKNINAIDTEKFIDAIINGEFENIKYTGEK